MHFLKNLFILLLCLTMSSSLRLGDKCYVTQFSRIGRCQNLLECDSFLTAHLSSEYCDKAKSLICCIPLTFEDGKCFDALSGVRGKCQNLLDCNYYALNYRKKPQYCTDGTVCCPPVHLRTSDKMCLEYHTSGVEADNVTATKKAFRKPNSHLAAIGFQFLLESKILWACSGSIISPFFILSHADCVNDNKVFYPEKWVRIGDIEQLDLTTEGVSHQDFRVVDTFIHPDYEYPYHNIALLKLEEAIVFGDDYQPACLHTHTNVPEIMEEIIWESNGTFYYLQRELKVFDYKTCAILYSEDVGIWPSGVIDAIQICAWDDSGNHPCLVNLGDVLQYKVEGLGNVRGHHVVAGVGSRAVCGPIVFTRVSAYLDWIEEIVWKDEIEAETVTFVFTN